MQWVSQNASPLLRSLKLNERKKNKLSMVTQLISHFYLKEGSTQTTAGSIYILPSSSTEREVFFFHLPAQDLTPGSAASPRLPAHSLLQG